MKGDCVMTFENALKKIKTEFTKADASKLADMAVQVTLSDEDCGGTFYFIKEGADLLVEGYDHRDNDAEIDIQRKSLMDILAGKTTLDAAIEKGTATVSMKSDVDDKLLIEAINAKGFEAGEITIKAGLIG